MISLNQIFRNQLTYLALTFLMILLGLASRIYGYLLFDVLELNAGDALWAAMVYFGVRFILVTRPPKFSLLVSLIFCFAIEFSQIYQGEWINSIRGTTLGALILGRGFLIVDLWRYTIGVSIAYVLDMILKKFFIKSTT
ncbi:ribosomal maturation YjgA family protein [Psychrobacillus sp. FSL K6-1267]|uniref:ribosomal maturation YjgA family protein n=1 Tax=Psychrobacillus sp. FSL K6-1267 TaxID=2921543 RepID=UPI0030FA5881